MDQFLIIGLVSTVLLSLIVYLVLSLLNKKKGKKTNFFLILLFFLFVFGLVYGIKINEFFRIICGILLLGLPATGILYYLRVADKKLDRAVKNFIKIYVGMVFVIFGVVVIVMLYDYRKDLQNIKNHTKPLYAEENSIFTTDNKTCGSTFFEGIGYRVEYCSKYVNKDSYRIKLWVDSKWKYEANDLYNDDSNWCNCETKDTEEDENEDEDVEELEEEIVEEETEEKEESETTRSMDVEISNEESTEEEASSDDENVEENNE